jgi:hypothetical protein
MNSTTHKTTNDVNAKAAAVQDAIERMRTLKHAVSCMIDGCMLGMAADMTVEAVESGEEDANDGYRDLCWLETQVDVVAFNLAKVKAAMDEVKEQVGV